MAAFASWTTLGETTFLLQPKMGDAFTLPWGAATYGCLPVGGQRVVTLSRSAKQDVRIRRDKELLAFKAPELRRSGPVELDTLTRAIEGLRLTSDHIVDANWVDNGLGWREVLLRSRANVLALRPDFAVLSGCGSVLLPPGTP